ncbi:type VI secretion system protein [Anaeromyxobacter diazotrophicus]|nr:type VI secretion system protein [Anaeromyxobacter diazotrophicus]
MNEGRTADHIASLLHARWVWAAAAALTLLGAAGGALPLLEVPGFELGLAAALLSALLVGPALGIAAARRALAAAAARRGGAGFAPGAAPRAPILRPFAAAAMVLLGLQALLFSASAARAALATPCRPLAGAALFALVAAPSALLAAALGVACGLAAAGRRRRAALLYALVAAASLLGTLAAGYFGPSASALDHLLGVWPGPLYDEALAVDRRLLLFRAGTLAWTCAALAAGALWQAQRDPRRRAWAALALALAALAALGARALGGGTATRAELAGALGAVREGARCTVHLPREKSAEEAERLLLDCEYDAAAVARALGLARAPRATVWLYRSAEEKRRLVGAGHTSFTKPWLAEIHVHDQGVPHPVLRHELVHALASAAAPGLLGVPARKLLLVDAGLTEGLAVAVEVPAGPFDVHAWTRALRDQGRLPPLASLLGPAGFWSAAPARAYTAAGSFLRFLLDRYGSAAVLAAYAEDDVPRALGRSLPALEAEWQAFLDGVSVPPALAAQAEARFERGSLFSRVCAREVADLEVEAARDAARGRAAAAERLLRRASSLSGGDPAWLRGAAEAWRAAGEPARAEALLAEALGRAEAAGGRSALRASLLEQLGDLRLGAGDGAAAAARYRAARALAHPAGAEARALDAKLAAARDAPLAQAVTPWLLGGPGAPGAVARLAGSDAPLARYLLARARLAGGAPELAIEALRRLDPGALPGPELEEEARRLAAEALCRAGQAEAGIAAFRALARAAPPASALRAQAEDAAARCAFERDARGAR